VTASVAESWLPLAIALGWWVAMYPGLYGEDSLMGLAEAVHGPVTVWFTAWWIYVIRIVSLGGRYVPLVSLGSVLTLTWAVREWMRACFPRGHARVWALCIICATPLVGALGIQLRHDAPMTAGLLIWAAVATRTRGFSTPLARRDYLHVLVAVLLLATRHNGLPTLAAAGVLGMLAPGMDRRRYAAAAVLASIGIVAVTFGATRVSGQDHSVDRLQSIEWAIADMSCLLAKDDVTVSSDDWQRLERVATRSDWTRSEACRTLNPIYLSPTFNRAVATDDADTLLRTWASLAIHNPIAMARVHAERVRLLLPPFVGGWPTADTLPFIHSTILPNEFGLTQAFPRFASAARLPIRAWNYLKLLLANAGLWLLILGALTWWRRGDLRFHLLPTIAAAIALELVILATAPISEGRYGLFILICGQAAALHAVVHQFSSSGSISSGG
jgi:hypothetical protein